MPDGVLITLLKHHKIVNMNVSEELSGDNC